MSRKTFLTGLIGAPIPRSASPAMHEQAAHDLGLRCHYQLIEVAGADSEELRGLLNGARRLGFAGVNVTFPYKEAVVGLLDELSPDAAALRAVSTVVIRDNRLIGCDADTTGFTRAAAKIVANSGQGSVAVIGAGGIGKAIAFALVNLGIVELRISMLTVLGLISLQFSLGLALGLLSWSASKMSFREPLVSSMEHRLECSQSDIPLPATLLHCGLSVADAVYFPLWTPLCWLQKQKGRVS